MFDMLEPMCPYGSYFGQTSDPVRLGSKVLPARSYPAGGVYEWKTDKLNPLPERTSLVPPAE